MEYTPEQKTRLEIDKLSAEVADLRSWVRRWLGAAGGLLGIVTAAISILVASNQIRSSTQESQTKLQQADARLAAAERLESERLARDAKKQWEEITTQTDAKSKELQARNDELAEKEKQLKEVTEKLTSAKESARSLAIAAKPNPFSAKAVDLIVEAEGLVQPGQWLGEASGVTLGIGYDLGFVTKESFESDWKNHLSPEQISRLGKAIGVTGRAAEALTPSFRDIIVTREAAVEVFVRVNLPLYVARTAQVFPGYEKLPPDAQGALVSLVFNRGGGLEGERRKEMRAIRDLVPSKDLAGIARELRAMKRLWLGKGGLEERLAARREAEAALLESAK